MFDKISPESLFVLQKWINAAKSASAFATTSVVIRSNFSILVSPILDWSDKLRRALVREYHLNRSLLTISELVAKSTNLVSALPTSDR